MGEGLPAVEAAVGEAGETSVVHATRTHIVINPTEHAPCRP